MIGYRLDCCYRNGKGYAKGVAIFHVGPLSWAEARDAFEIAIRSEVGHEDDPLVYHVVPIGGAGR